MALKRNQFSVIDGAVSQFDEIETIVSSAMNMTTEISNELINIDPDDPEIQGMKEIMADYAEAQIRVMNFKRAYAEIKEQSLTSDSPLDGLDTKLLSAYEELNKDAAQEAKLSADYLALLELIAQASRDDGVVESSQPAPAAGSNRSIDGFEVMAGTTDIPIDPISRLPVNDPVRNKMCRHVYDRANVLQYIKYRPDVRCPMLGCGNKEPLTAEVLVDDRELKRIIDRQKHDRNKL